MLFTQDLLKNNDEVKSLRRPSDRFKLVKQMWTQLGEKEIEQFRQMAEEDKKRLLAEIEGEEDGGSDEEGEEPDDESDVESEFNIDMMFTK